jgi:hypothetical protein
VLGKFGVYNLDDAAFAIYPIPGNKISTQGVASALEKEWLEKGMEDHLARPSESTIELKTLRDVVHAHEALDKGIQERSDSGAKGNMEWRPNAFVVVWQDWRSKPACGGLLFVFADKT